MNLLFLFKSIFFSSKATAEEKKKIIHLAPRNGIGGVETALKSMEEVKHHQIDFKVEYIVQLGTNSRAWQQFTNFISPLPLLLATKNIIFGDADVLIVSLWRSAIVGILAKCFRPKLKLVIFIHNSTNVHWLDFIFNRWAISLAHEVWSDSHASLNHRFPKLVPKQHRVISFVTRRLEALPSRKASPDFIFWGRINVQKGLDFAIRIFAEMVKTYPDARFWIIGPDEGPLESLQQLSKSLGLTNNIIFLGKSTSAEIEKHALKATFYLQTSLYEGMAMSVVEAMQLGLVPIVTPAGEIPSYCIDKFNSLIVKSEQEVIKNLKELLNNNNQYQEARHNSIATWKDTILYAESVLMACEKLLTEDDSRNY